MAALTITCGLGGFRLVRHISHFSEEKIVGEAQFDQAPLYVALEAMAQIAALDVRRRIDFKAHAFLLKISHCRWPAQGVIDGCFSIQAIPGSRSRRAFAYGASAQDPAGLMLEAELMIGTVAYDQDFQQQCLQEYYRNLFTCLQNATSAS